MSTRLLESAAPGTGATAVVEDDGESVYLYLANAPGAAPGLRACWVRNLVPAPASLDRQRLLSGRPPLLPVDWCAHPEGAPRPADLSLVWFESGDGVALFEGRELLALIPPWGADRKFPGFARDSLRPSAFAAPFPEDDRLLRLEIERARDFWQTWETDPWPSLRGELASAYESVLGPALRTHDLDAGQWPPRLASEHRVDDAAVLVTAGMSTRPMSAAAEHVDRPAGVWRVELALAMDGSLAAGHEDKLAGYLNAASSLPWRRRTWFGAGHAIGCDTVPVGPSGERFVAMLLTPTPPGVPPVQMPRVFGDRPLVLWMLPITDAERRLLQTASSAELLERLEKAGVTWVHRDRASVA